MQEKGKGGSESNGVVEKDKRWGASDMAHGGFTFKDTNKVWKAHGCTDSLVVEVPELRRSATRHLLYGFMLAFNLRTKGICKG